MVRPDGKDITDGPAISPEIAAALMNEDEVVRIVRSYLEGVFPKVCGRCGQRFDSLREYLEATTHLSTPVLYDDIDGDIPVQPMGPMSLANCRCGTTLVIASGGIPQAQMVVLLTWAKSESSRRSIDIRELLRHIRDRIDQQILGTSQPDVEHARRLAFK